jgi:hypothetical protein
MSKPARLVMPRWRAIDVRFVLMLAVVLVGSLAGGGSATAATQAPTFVRTDYQQLGNNHVLGDFNARDRRTSRGMPSRDSQDRTRA